MNKGDLVNAVAEVVSTKKEAQEAVECPDCLHESPQFPKVRRLDETAAARNPCLKG